MAPVLFELRRHGAFAPAVVSTGQHSDLATSAFSAFGIVPDAELAVMTAGQTPSGVAARVLERLPAVLARLEVAAVLVQGDTTTVLAAGLAAFHIGVPVGHVEAGLRTFDLGSPFPEEANRQLTDRLARWCFVPTERARQNLLAEGIPERRIHLCGNTAVDAILWMCQRAPSTEHVGSILVTLHRRESFGQPLIEVLKGINDFLEEQPNARVVWPVHPNPNVMEAAAAVIGNHPRFARLPPLSYAEFSALLRDCRFVLSDSGGIQEEAPSLGKRVLIPRAVTERPEAVELGLNRIVGRERQAVARALSSAWSEPAYGGALPAPNPYGDGHAASRIVTVLADSLSRGGAA